MNRSPFEKRTFLLREDSIRDRAIAVLKNLPIDAERPLQVTISEYKLPRKLDQNALYHAGPLRDCAEQIWLEGKQFSAETLHHYFKVQFLPEEYNEEECLKNYQKWSYDPAGERVLIGSTTQLTVKGFSIFLEQVFAFGGNLGVVFHASLNERNGS